MPTIKRYRNYLPGYKSQTNLQNGDNLDWCRVRRSEIKYSYENIKNIEKLVVEGIEIVDVKSIKLFTELYKSNLLTEYSSLDISNPYIRNIFYLDFLKININYSEILSKKILVFGAGAVGCNISYLLAQFGYKNVIVIDDDRVEESDIYKTLIYRRSDIGQFKVDSLRICIESNFAISIETFIDSPKKQSEISSYVELLKPDLIIKACDPNLSFRYYLNEICFGMKIPFVYMSYSFERINIGPFFVPGLTKSDKEIEFDFSKKFGNSYSYLGHEKLFSDYTIHPSVSFNINILSNIMLKEILFFHLNKFEFVFSLNKEVFFFPLTMKVFYKDLSKL